MEDPLTRSSEATASSRRLKPLSQIGRERGITPKRMRSAIRRGELRAHRLGLRTLYVTDADLDVWLRTLTAPVSPSAEAWADEKLRKTSI